MGFTKKFLIAGSLILSLLAIGCDEDKAINQPKTRMRLIERLEPYNGSSTDLLIVSVDGKEYLVNQEGGIIALPTSAEKE